MSTIDRVTNKASEVLTQFVCFTISGCSKGQMQEINTENKKELKRARASLNRNVDEVIYTAENVGQFFADVGKDLASIPLESIKNRVEDFEKARSAMKRGDVVEALGWGTGLNRRLEAAANREYELERQGASKEERIAAIVTEITGSNALEKYHEFKRGGASTGEALALTIGEVSQFNTLLEGVTGETLYGQQISTAERVQKIITGSAGVIGTAASLAAPIAGALESKLARTAATAKIESQLARPCLLNSFISNTQILTDSGHKNIEDIKVGDNVWSRNLTTEQEGFKRVKHVFHSHPATLVHLTYRLRDRAKRPVAMIQHCSETTQQCEDRDSDSGEEGDSDSGSGEDDDPDPDGIFELIGTPGHPIWSLSRHQWISLDRLKPDEELLLAGSKIAEIVNVWVELVPKATDAVYNFEIEDWQTYYVAPIGSTSVASAVWVHNCQVVWEIKDNFPPGSRESKQLRRFVKAWNEEIKNAGGSMTRRSLTAAEESQSLAWKRQMRSDYPSRFKDKVLGHTPDAAAGGKVAQGRAMALDPSVNASIGGQVSAKPVGYTYGSIKVIREK